MKMGFLSFALLLGWPFLMWAQHPVPGVVKVFHEDRALAGASVGVYVSDLASGRILVADGADLLLAPASTLKTVTTAAALELLGPGYRFKTLYGYRGQLKAADGELEGDLVVRGGGDPTLGSAEIGGVASPQAVADAIAARVKAAGIASVRGDLVLDLSAWQEADLPGSWAWEDVGNYYGAAPSALTFADNLITLWFDTPAKSGEAVIMTGCAPVLPWLSWQNELTSSAVNRDLAYVYGSPWGEKRVIRGTLPAGRKGFSVKASMPEPPRWFGEFLRSRLNAAGIAISGNLSLSALPVSFTPLDSLVSPPLQEIIREINHKSINLFTEHLVMQIALAKSGRGSLSEGLRIISAFWKEKGAGDALFMEDGSGLSRYNAVSARFLAKALALAVKNPAGEIFRNSLPTAGNGTLTGFSAVAFPGETLRCKSGSMERVRGYAGYLTGTSGTKMVFAVLVNNYPGTSAEVTSKIRDLLTDIRNKY
ncbi:MAG TPA: D-alanyl-D-alanine carboxypeptidase/D-alanyl-D-alanine-endopeptidase [Prolixibacteraceae bacterium]|nr:D-alanyl-D-alanine carboxypeptidase/D-alanyl-D-alanine-endopeptidase [Prolixibacteraceae bacterium]HRV88935.1 D-alanyl-D-alanine carboxypeptidase/D-alanyl-D-alanine-endopeptidase [Prolixibacteraceae bacterium]